MKFATRLSVCALKITYTASTVLAISQGLITKCSSIKRTSCCLLSLKTKEYNRTISGTYSCIHIFPYRPAG
jgi:hypothetical protein